MPRQTTEILMQAAVSAHQSGAIEIAAKGYEEVLEREPKHPHAWHLLGVTKLQQGDADTAIQYIDTALNYLPGHADFYRNLFFALEAAGCAEQIPARMNTALEACTSAASRASIYFEQGRIAAQNHRLQPAITALKTATALWGSATTQGSPCPDMARAQMQLAVLYSRCADLTSALRYAQKATALQPGDSEFHSTYAQLAFSAGDLVLAGAEAKKTLELVPAQVAATTILALCLVEQGSSQHARQILKEAEARHGPDPMLCATEGEIELRLENFSAAVPLFENALKSAPQQLQVRISLAVSLAKLERFQQAFELLQVPVASDDEKARLLETQGLLHSFAGELEQATKAFRASLRRVPDNIEVLYKLISLDPKLLPDSTEASSIQRVLKRDEPDKTRALAHFALARVLDNQQQWTDAFKHYQSANRLMARIMPDPGDAEFTQATAFAKALLSARHDSVSSNPPGFQPGYRDHTARAGAPHSITPIFILGLPRAGSTLVEQIIASHSRICGLGELSALAKARREFQHATGMPFARHAMHYPVTERVTALQRARTAYLDAASNNSGFTDTTFFTDKLPFNFFHIPFIRELFPDAPIIHVQRAPLDTALSMYTQKFSRGNAYSYDLDRISQYIRNYAKLFEYWEALYSDQIYSCYYEKLVTIPEHYARELIQATGLDWQDPCLNFHHNRRKVETASLWQVRQPLYSSSINRWHHYQEELFALEEQLGTLQQSYQNRLISANPPG